MRYAPRPEARLFRLVSLAPLTLASLPALAGGYYYSEAGIVSTGRGGAWVAGADTQFAQMINPAGIIKVEDPTFNIGLSAVQQNIRFTRTDAFGFDMDEVKNQAAPYAVPQFGFAMPIGDKFSWAFGFYSPFAPSSKYEPDGNQRYSIIDTTIQQFTLGPSIAVRPIPQLTIGLGFSWELFRVREKLTVTLSGPNPDGSDRPQSDITFEVGVHDWFTPSFNAGFLVEPIPQLSIGASIEPPFKVRAKGQAEAVFSDELASAFGIDAITDEDILFDLDLPLVLRAGVAVRPIPNLEIELAGDYQRWQSLTELKVRELQLEGLPIEAPEEVTLPAELNDSFSIRLGGEYRVNDMLEVRAGGFWEKGAFDDADLSVALYDTNKVQVGTGASLWFLDGRLRVDASTAYIAFQNKDITNSQVTQVNVLDPEGGGIVGNGQYRTNGWILSTQLQWAFKKKKGADPGA